MSYVRVKLGRSTPPTVRQFIKTIEDLYFQDVHSMLRLPLPDMQIHAGLNFAITQVLMSVISSTSIILYDNKGDIGNLFKGVVEKYFPWDEEPESSVSPKAAAESIYDIFRNPLTHNGGLSIKKKGAVRYLGEPNYVATIERFLAPGTNGHSERWIENLERDTSRPKMDPTLRVQSGKKVLLVEGLYWCVRRMIQKLSEDSERMASAKRFLQSKNGFPPTRE